MRRYIVAGIVLFAMFLVVFAPAGLLKQLLSPLQGVELQSPTGTLWRGSADLYLADLPAGLVDWSFRPATILKGSLGYHVRLTGPDHALTADVAAAPSRITLSAEGSFDSQYLNPWMAPYEIGLGGEIRLDDVALSVFTAVSERDAASPALAPGEASGSLHWTGGNVRYRLSGQSYSGNLPPLVAVLGEGLEAYVYPRDEQTPLLRAQLLDNGFIKIGITRLLTRLLNNPWPGSDADHETVLEVEEQLF